jgi:hypothetical protein
MSLASGPIQGSPHTMHPRLVGCWAKVERAKDHRSGLANEILSFNQTNPGRLEGTYNSSSGLHVIRIISVPTIPLSAGVSSSVMWFTTCGRRSITWRGR